MPILEHDKTSFISRRDVVVGGLVSVLAVASWTLPETRWLAFAQRIARFRIKQRGPLTPGERAMITIVVGDRTDDWVDEIYWPKALGHKYLSWMQILAGHAPRRWQPDVRLIGGEHVDRAREGGRGVVLLTATFAYKDLMAKAAFAQAGYGISHLSKDTHGFSETRFGKCWLNPIYTSVEERYLRERMVFSGQNTKDVSIKLRERLQQNAPVMITVTPLGRRVACRPFLGGQIHIATGGLNFAAECGTPVLPVFTLRQHDGAITTFVGAPLDQPRAAGRNQKIDTMLADYVPRLEKTVLSEPDQFSFPLSDQFGQPLLSRISQPRPNPVSASTEMSAA